MPDEERMESDGPILNPHGESGGNSGDTDKTLIGGEGTPSVGSDSTATSGDETGTSSGLASRRSMPEEVETAENILTEFESVAQLAERSAVNHPGRFPAQWFILESNHKRRQTADPFECL